MALTSRKSHRGPVFRCQMCPWEGDKKGVTWHVISTHREVEEAPYFCRVCPARFVTARVWRKHTSQASHRAKLILRPEQAATALGQGGLSVRFEGPESEAVQMDRGYSEKYWMLVSQASATKPLETDDEDDDEAPSPTPSNRSTPSPAKLKQRPDRGELSHKAEERPVSATKVSDKSAPRPEKKSSDRDAAHSTHKSEKQDVGTSRHGSPSPADDVIVLAPSDEETDPGLQSDWQEELDYGEDQDWEPGMCPQDTKTMGGLRGTGPTVPDGSSDKENWAESSPLSSRTGPTLLPVPVEPTPSTSREPTLPTRQEPDPLTGMTTSHPLFAVGPDWPQQLGKAAGEAFAEGLRVALKPLEEESKRQTAALEKLAKDEKKTAEALQAVLKALSNKEHRRDEGG